MIIIDKFGVLGALYANLLPYKIIKNEANFFNIPQRPIANDARKSCIISSITLDNTRGSFMRGKAFSGKSVVLSRVKVIIIYNLDGGKCLYKTPKTPILPIFRIIRTVYPANQSNGTWN